MLIINYETVIKFNSVSINVLFEADWTDATDNIGRKWILKIEFNAPFGKVYSFYECVLIIIIRVL